MGDDKLNVIAAQPHDLVPDHPRPKLARLQSPRRGGAVLPRLRGRRARARGASLKTPLRPLPTQQRAAAWSARLRASCATYPTPSQPCAATSLKPYRHGALHPGQTWRFPDRAGGCHNHANRCIFLGATCCSVRRLSDRTRTAARNFSMDATLLGLMSRRSKRTGWAAQSAHQTCDARRCARLSRAAFSIHHERAPIE